jgi:WD40 repeat protein
MGPSRVLPLRPALVAALAVPGCRAVYAVTFGLNGDTLAAGDGNGRTYLWDTDGGLAATFARPGSHGVLGVAFDPDDDLLAAADGNGRAYLWDLVRGELARTFVPRHREPVHGVGAKTRRSLDNSGLSRASIAAGSGSRHNASASSSRGM